VTPSRIWPLLASKYAPEDVLPRWQARLGDEYARAKPLLAETGDTTSTWACGREREGCARLVHRYGAEVAAACGATFDRCARVTLDGRDLVLWLLDERRVIDALRRALRIEGGGTPPDRLAPEVSWLGQRVVAGVPLRFYLARHADAALCAEVAGADARDDAGLAVLLVYRATEPAVAGHARARGVSVVDLAASGALLDGGELDVDLDDLYHEHRERFVGVDPTSLLSARKRLIIDYAGGRVWLDGQLVHDRWRSELPFRLLVAFARRPGALVNRRLLYAEMWENGRDRSTHEQYGKLIRSHRGAIDERVLAHVTPTSGNDDQGGWTLALPPSAVELWSEPPAFTPPIQQRKRKK
jgi:hypothetical protein